MQMRRGPFILTLAGALTGATCLALGQTSAPTRVAPPAAVSPQPPRGQSAAPPATSRPADSALRDLAEFMERAAALKDNDIEARLILARWARSREMWSQAAEMANQALYRDPGNRAAYLVLQQVDDARPLPEEPAIEKAITAESIRFFNHEFKTRNTKHFLICYDTEDAFAAKQGATMEKVYDAFQFYFTMNTLRPDFLDQRLVVLLLKDRSDYLDYGRRTERQDLSWSAGFYSARTNRSIFYDDSSGPTAAGVAKQIDGLKAAIANLNQQISAAAAQNQRGLVNSLTVDRNRAGEALAQLNTRIGNTVQMLNNVKTMHEAAHQIAFNTGIQTRLVDYPLWFSEGLACSFEIEDGAGRRGPAILNFGRIAHIKDAIRDNKLIPLEQFITAPPPEKMDDATAAVLYAEGWGLFHYLFKFHREGMEKYLLAYKNHAPLRAINADERRVIFTKAFGDDLEDLNKKFVAYLKSLPAKPN